MRQVVSILVQDEPGVLSRVVGLVSRRGFNIESLSVAPSERAGRSRITAVVDADEVAFEQIAKQLNKLIPVHKVKVLAGEAAVERQLALFKVTADPSVRGQVAEVAGMFRAKVVRVLPAALVIEATGEASKLEALERLLADYGIVEITRTGTVAMRCDEGADAVVIR